MLVTTVPSIVITLIIFTVLGLTHGGGDPGQIGAYDQILRAHFTISPWLLLVPVGTGVMIALKMPALPVLGLSTLLAAVFAVLFQPSVIAGIGQNAALAHDVGRTLTQGQQLLAGTIETIYNTVSIDTGNAQVNELVTSRGMTGMLNTVYLIICAMCFGACMRASGMIAHLARALTRFTRRRTGLVASTVGSGVVLNGLVCDQYLSIILTSNIFKDIYEREGYENRLLSRSIEDSATITSPLFPWSSCGMTQATILSTPTLVYLPYCFFNLISPLMSILIAATGYKIFRKKAS